MEYREGINDGQEETRQLSNDNNSDCSIRFGSAEVKCPHGSNLRKVLMENGLGPYHKDARFVHCRGIGTCGTCTVDIVSGNVSEPNRMERARLNLPPFSQDSGFRLACQCKVLSNIVVVKHPGFWGERKS